jgi:hypothetical protein
MTQGKLNTKCPFMTGIDMVSCSALKEVYVPSTYELKEYCKSSLHTMCSRNLMRERSSSADNAGSAARRSA